MKEPNQAIVTFECNAEVNTIPPSSGIYLIKNMLNNRIYIGSAVNLHKRYLHHRSQLVGNAHGNKFLQNDWNKTNDPSKYIFWVESLHSKENLIREEQKFLDLLFDEQKVCYNLCSVAGSTLGLKHTLEAKKRISEMMKGEKHHFFGKHHGEDTLIKMSKIQKIIKQRDEGIKVNMFSLDGKLIKQYDAIIEAARENDVDKKCIYEAINMKRGHNIAKGFAWKFSNDESPIVYSTKKRRALEIEQYSLDGKLIQRYDSLENACDILKCGSKNITDCCKGVRESFRGFIFCYKK